MGNQLDKIVESIDSKVRLLSERYSQCRQEMDELLRENRQLRDDHEKEKKQKNNAEENNKVLKIAGAVNASYDKSSTDAKLKINELVRDIDKCIAMLNK